MNSDELESLKKQIFDLENENKNLHKQLDQLREEDEKTVSYRLFVEAREHFLKWLNVITLGLASVGVIAIIGLYFEASQQISLKIADMAPSTIKPIIEKEAIKIITKDLEEFKQLALKNIVQSQVQYQLTQDNPSSPRFFVVVGSSNNLPELSDEYRRAKEISGDAFGISKYDVKICEPLQDGGNYALLIGSAFEFPKAEQVIRQAIADNFRATNTFPISESAVFFKTDKCETIQPAENKT